ncbi:chaperonin 10-like protein [Phycomyces nitens]|nr:chaperonin 10-like protein [Phycomyces nitens]
MSSDTFHGWACPGKDKPLEWTELPLKEFDDYAVEMNVTHCGICGSDIHTLDSGWCPTNYPCVVGHEITGVCTRVGKNVKRIKVGDRIGVGAQSGSCLKCESCKKGEENLCTGGFVGTYDSHWPNGDKSFGGYADKWRGHEHFVFKVPDNMSNELAATFFCAGVTTYSPLKRFGVKPGDKVGVIGIGGLGHFGVQWAKAMGATVVALSHSDRKRADCKELGCHDYIVTSKKEEMDAQKGTFTHILSTSFGREFDWGHYLGLLKPNGHFIIVGIPEVPLSGIPALVLAMRQVSIVGSAIGSPAVIEDMLQFAAAHGVKPWISKYPMKEANEAVKAMREGKARYRFVLEN